MSNLLRLPWLILLPSLLLGACSDNVTCIFTTGCQAGAGPISSNPAQLPVDGQWIVDGPPDVSAVFPTGSTNPGSVPVVVVFSESIVPATLQGAIEIVPLASGGGVGSGGPIRGVSQTLISDGRVLVLLTSTPLVAGDYSVSLATNANVTDLTGQGLNREAEAQLGTFTVAATPPTDLTLVTTYPPDDARFQSETTQIVVAFDRPVQPSSVNGLSFDVKVGGVDPLDDPLATPLIGSSGNPDTRIFLYRSVDDHGGAVPLGTDATVTLALSPTGNRITAQDGGVMAARNVNFSTLAFAAPLGASLLSNPHDAIGLANLTPGDPEELTLEVQLDAAEPNDVVDLFLFGQQRTDLVPPTTPIIALQRFVRLSGTAPITTVTFTRADIALQISSDPADVHFQDGSVTFALRARRGNAASTVRVLDLDPDPDVIQDPQLDTKRPVVVALGNGTGTATVHSDQRDIVLSGQASESVKSVEVTTGLGSNGTLAPVVGSSATGLFLAAPVTAAILAAPTNYSLIARDAALNTSTQVDGTFTQLGAVGPGAFTVGQTLDVEVFDAGTLDVLADALVLVHSDQGNGTDFPFVQAGLTLADGHVSLATAGAPSVAAIVTVVKPGYDLFTLQGVPSTRLSLPLRRSNRALAQAAGAVRSSDAATIALLPGMDRRFDDSRRPLALPRGFAGDVPTTGGGLVICNYGPEPIRTDRLGARSFFAGNFALTAGNFSASQLLQAFVLAVPLAGVALPGAIQVADLQIGSLLIDAATPPEDTVQALPACVLRVDATSGVDLLDLADDVETTGEPFVDVETLIPGVPSAIAVSEGVAFTLGTGLWTVRAAQPGAITPGGSLGSQGIVDTDPFLRMEVQDSAGNAAGARPRLSTIVAGGTLPEFRALATPAVHSPAAGAHTGAQAFTLLLNHAIDDARTEGGLYRVELVDPVGRGWTLWRLDPSGSSDVEVRVVDVADGGGVGLLDGTLDASASAFAWAGFQPDAFLWSDIEREFELFSSAALHSFDKP